MTAVFNIPEKLVFNRLEQNYTWSHTIYTMLFDVSLKITDPTVNQCISNKEKRKHSDKYSL